MKTSVWYGMDVHLLSEIAFKWDKNRRKNRHRTHYCPPEAKVITGDPISDAAFYYFEQESGLELKVSDDFTKIVGYNVLDEKKFTWFLLRWS